MDRRTTSRTKFVALQVRALALSLLTAVMLVAAYTFISGWRAAHAAHVSGSQLLVPLQLQVGLALWISAFYGATVALVCAPIWMFIVKRRRANALLAVALGFVAPMILWIAINQNGYWSVGELLLSGFPYGICGGVAGLVAWCSSPRASKPIL